VVVHMDQRSTDLLILENGRAVLARTLSGGASDIEEGHGEEIDSGLRRTLASFRSQGGVDLETVYLTGLGPESAECALLVERVLGRPLGELPLPTPPIVPPEWAPRFVRALALASRMVGREKRLNLRQGEFAATRSIGGIRKHGLLLAVSGFALVVCFLFSVVARRYVLAEEHEALAAQLATTTEELFGEEVHTAAEARALLQRPAAAGDPLPAFDAFDALDALSRSIPASITHTTRRLLIEVDDETRDGRLEIEGEVGTIADRDTIATALEEHGCFKDLERGPTRPGRNNAGTVYRIESSIRCAGSGGDEPATADDARTARRER
jgi:general secretion pathway protein L